MLALYTAAGEIVIIKTSVVATIRHAVENIVPCDSLERQHQQDTLAWIQSGLELFRIEKPDKPPKHLVSYFVVVDPDHHSVLLVDHIKAQRWLPTGGHVEANEDPKNTVIREADEELGIQATFLYNDDRPLFITVSQTVGLTPGHTDVSLWYVLRGDVHQRLTHDRREFTDIAWFTFDEILEYEPTIFDPHMHRFTRKLQAYLHKKATH